jgi:CRP/FNR family transcriptional regulator
MNQNKRCTLIISDPSQVSCQNCSLNPVCLPIAVNESDLNRLDSIIHRSPSLKKNSHVFQAGDDFKSIYAVRTGTIKTYTLSESGDEQITGFYLPGEVFGIDGLSNNIHSNGAKALESASVCEIPFENLEELSIKIPSLQRHFFKIMSKEIQADQELIMLLSKKTSDQRIVSFLLSLSARQASRGLSQTHFNLAMSRIDISNYLGLAVETVSRIFTLLQKKELISVKGKEISILNHEALCDI